MSSNLLPIPVGPANAELVTTFIGRCKQSGFDFCPSDPGGFSPSSLIFYHVPKTGGLRFGQPLSRCVLALREDVDLLNQLNESGIGPGSILIQGNQGHSLADAAEWNQSLLITAHQYGWGGHASLGRHKDSPKLYTATLLRRPADRLSSALKYLWSLNGQSLGLTLEAIKRGHAHIDNPLTRIFSNLPDIGALLGRSAVDQALEALLQVDFCLHQENYSPARGLQQKFATDNRLPNILTPSFINRTPVQPPSEVMEELRDCAVNHGANIWDIELYERLMIESPIDMKPASFSINALHPLTFILEAKTDANGGTSFTQSLGLVRTLDLLLGKIELPQGYSPETLALQA